MSGATWLLKTEPDSFSLDDLRIADNGTTGWDGVRNYQARNRLRDDLQEGDRVLIYHSSCPQPAIVGEARVTRAGYPEPEQFIHGHPQYDPKSSPDNPRWYQVDIQFQRAYPCPLTLKHIKGLSALANMELVTKPRLSVQQVSDADYRCICEAIRELDTQ